MNGFLSAQFRADDPFEGIAPGSAVAEYDVVIGPVVHYLRDVVTDRSVRLLANFIGTSRLEDESKPDVGDSDHVYEILCSRSGTGAAAARASSCEAGGASAAAAGGGTPDAT
ncbi:hypothetical protein ACQPTN_20460 [Bradyrhizobium sp. 13971]